MLSITFKPFVMSVIMLIVVMQSVIMLNAVMLRVVMLSVAAPLRIIVRMIVRSFVEFQRVFKQTNKKGFHSMRNFGHIFSRPKILNFKLFFLLNDIKIENGGLLYKKWRSFV